MKHFLVFAALILVIPLTTQAGWLKTYGDEYHDEAGMTVQGTSDGGYVVFGNITSGAGSSYIWLLKTDAQGDTQWTKTYGDQTLAHCYSGQQTKDGGYILTGFTWDSGDEDIWLIKTDAAGDTQWTKTYGETGYDEAYSIQETSDDGYIVTGTHDGLASPWDGDMWLLKTNSEGDTLWTKTWSAVNPTMTDAGNCVRQTPDGGYIIACYADYSSATRNGIVVMRTDEEGDTLWAYRDTIWFMECVAQTSDDACVATGFNNEDMFIVKLDSDGSLLWKKVYGDARRGYRDFGYCVQATPDGGCVVAGEYSYNYDLGIGDAWFLKLDSDGDTSWTRTYGYDPGFDEVRWVQPTSDGGYVLAGSTETWSSGGSDLFIMKTDSLGSVALQEEPVVENPQGFEIANPIGREIVVRYTDHPEGFRAQVYDASGRKIDELHSTQTSGILTWGERYGPGVYFIVAESIEATPVKVVIVK